MLVAARHRQPRVPYISALLPGGAQRAHWTPATDHIRARSRPECAFFLAQMVNGVIVHVYVVLRLLEAEHSCGKGRRAFAVTYINATPADVSNGFTFTPPCVLGRAKHSATNVRLNVRLCRAMINIPGGPKVRCRLFLNFQGGYQLHTPLQWFQGRKGRSFLFCNVAKLFWRAMVSLCVYPEDYNLLSSWKQKKDLATPIICSLFLTIKA